MRHCWFQIKCHDSDFHSTLFKGHVCSMRPNKYTYVVTCVTTHKFIFLASLYFKARDMNCVFLAPFTDLFTEYLLSMSTLPVLISRLQTCKICRVKRNHHHYIHYPESPGSKFIVSKCLIDGFDQN